MYSQLRIISFLCDIIRILVLFFLYQKTAFSDDLDIFTQTIADPSAQFLFINDVTWSMDDNVIGSSEKKFDVLIDVLNDITTTFGAVSDNIEIGAVMFASHNFSTSETGSAVYLPMKKINDTVIYGGTTKLWRELLTESLYQSYGGTNLGHGLYEGVLYLRGDTPIGGLSASPASIIDDNGINRDSLLPISHPDSYSGGTIPAHSYLNAINNGFFDAIPNCNGIYANHPMCWGSQIDNGPTYNSPLRDCGDSSVNIILLTDGAPTQSGPRAEIEALLGVTCASSSTHGITGNRSGYYRCLPELVEYFTNQDQSSLAGKQTFNIYTIAFGVQYPSQVEAATTGLTALANKGGGAVF